jgi:hypothetical protein
MAMDFLHFAQIMLADITAPLILYIRCRTFLCWPIHLEGIAKLCQN